MSLTSHNTLNAKASLSSKRGPVPRPCCSRKNGDLDGDLSDGGRSGEGDANPVGDPQQVGDGGAGGSPPESPRRAQSLRDAGMKGQARRTAACALQKIR